MPLTVFDNILLSSLSVSILFLWIVEYLMVNSLVVITFLHLKGTLFFEGAEKSCEIHTNGAKSGSCIYGLNLYFAFQSKSLNLLVIISSD